jgi:raffinose/stachyose/melibiose transport system permease protein
MQTFQKQETILVWSEVQFGIVLLTRPQNRTLSIGLLSFQGQFVSDQGAFFADLVIGTFSIVILFLIFQRYVTVESRLALK